MRDVKRFHFTQKYFRKLVVNDDNVRVTVTERPSLEISEEDYSLRVETRHEERKTIHRKYAIEHHHSQERHREPHLQFKFHSERIGTFWIELAFADEEEYERGILGFIYKLKGVLAELEKQRQGITEEILVLELVDGLADAGKFLAEKVRESIERNLIEFQEPIEERPGRLEGNPLLSGFLGDDNVKRIVNAAKEQMER